MNIFFLNNIPKECAQMHVDKHCVKMILEYAQLLSTAHRVIDGVEYIDDSSGRKIKRWKLGGSYEDILYKATHINHPSAIWVRQRESHYRWLFGLWIELMNEYTYRYGKVHASSRLIGYLNRPPINIEFGGGFDQPTPAMPDKYKVPGDSIQSYKNYYNGDKQHLANWKNRIQPLWFNPTL